MIVPQRLEHDSWQITGWKFDDLGIKIRQQLCEALYAASRAKQACHFANGAYRNDLQSSTDDRM